MDKNQKFVSSVKIADIPWPRLATAYGRATDFPQYFEAMLGSDASEAEKAVEQIALNIEHQNTLWPATPFAMIFLARILEKAFSDIKKDVNRRIAVSLLDLFIEVAQIFNMGDEMEHADPLPFFSDMLKEEYLWPEEYDEEDDEGRYEEDEGPFPDDLFYSFYYYSCEVLKFSKDTLSKYSNVDGSEVSDKVKTLFSVISCFNK